MITIKNFTELKSDPRSSGISAVDFGASKFRFDVDTVTKLIAVWSDETGGEELNFKIYDFDRKLNFAFENRSSTQNSNPAPIKFGWRAATARSKFRY